DGNAQGDSLRIGKAHGEEITPPARVLCSGNELFEVSSTEDRHMDRTATAIALSAALTGFVVGYVSRTAPGSTRIGTSETFSLVPPAIAQEKKSEMMPFNYNSPREPALAPDAPLITYWSADDLRKAHADLAEAASKALKKAGTGSSQSFGGGPVHVS